MAKKPLGRAATGRVRHQMTVSLGEGPTGLARREQLDQAAKSAGHETLSSWVLAVLMQAAGSPLDSSRPTRHEFELLAARVERVEAQLTSYTRAIR